MSSVVKLYPNGLTVGVRPAGGPKSRGNRTACEGWSHQSVRSNMLFLMSVLWDSLPPLGWSVSLSVLDCPPTPEDWHKGRRRFMKRCQRMGLDLGHWLTEWQRRQVPHLHGALFFRSGSEGSARAIEDAWLASMAEFRPHASAQHVAPLYDSVGWAQYLSKHAARGLNHYQRSPEKIPPAWLGKTGRMWGKVGQWPQQDAAALTLSMPGFHSFRRILRARRRADARASGNPRRIAHARRMLKCSDEKRSAVRGGSDWCDLEEGLALIGAVRALGYDVIG